MEGFSVKLLVLNRKNTLVQYIMNHADDESELLNMISKQIYDLAVLSHKPLTPEAMTEFVRRSNEIMKRFI